MVFKEPLPKKKTDSTTVKQPKAKPAEVSTEPSSFINEEFNKVENKSFRHSTARKREELERRQKEREEKRRKSNKPAQDEIQAEAERRRLTQEELLAEAKITEKINMASLGWY